MWDDDLFDPFYGLKRMQKKMKGLFDKDFMPKMDEIRQPLVDVVDKGKEIEVVAELPGVNKKDIELDINDNILSIKSVLRSEENEEKNDYYFNERSYQSFFRQFPLPAEVLEDKIKADFNNGILTVILPKKHPEEKPKGHRIHID